MDAFCIIFLILLLYYYLLKKRETFYNKERQCYLIPNSPKITKKLLLKLGKNKNDCLVFFNHCGPLKKFSISDLKELKSNKLLFLRANHNMSYWGKQEYNNQKYKIFNNSNTFIIPSRNAKMNKINNHNNFKIIQFSNLIKNYPKKKEPQSGFIAYHYIKNNFPEYKINLVGFDRKHGEAPADWYHEKNYELEFYKKNNINNIDL